MNNLVRKAVDLLGSRQLALLLFFATAVLALYGSFVPPEKAELVFFKGYGERSLPAARFLGLIDTYRSPVFLALLASIAVNLVVCTASRLLRSRRAGGVHRDRRGGMAAPLDLLMHLSVLLVLAGGGAKGFWGTTVTKNVYVGLSTESALDWRLDAEIPLGFTVLVKERVEEYYPPRARVGVKRSDTGAKIALLEVGAGSPATVPGGALALKLAAFERQGGRFFFSAVIAGEEAGFVLEGQKGDANVAAVGPYTFTLVSFRDDLRSVRSLIQVVEGAAVTVEGWLGPNERIAHRGTNIFQTAWGTDEFGNRFVGLQFVRDPGAPLFWAGCALLAVLMPAYLFQRHGRRTASPGAGADGHSHRSN